MIEHSHTGLTIGTRNTTGQKIFWCPECGAVKFAGEPWQLPKQVEEE
ncbi:hypothetical protein N9937_02040 [bacterium]|nr:hypothetical protein [bacterium]